MGDDIYGRRSIECCTCGMVWAMSATHDDMLRKTRAQFYCPNGHSQSYIGKTEVEKLKEQLEGKQRELDRCMANYDRSVRTYRCVFAGCDHSSHTKAALRKHLEREHGFAQKPLKALAEDAGPDARNSDVGDT